MKLVAEKSNAFVVTPRAARLAAAALLAGLFIVAFAARARQLLVDPYPIGVDGYYYVVQVRSLLETGQLNYPAARLGFYWLLPWAAAFGPVVGVKLGAAAGTALAVFPAYALARRVSGSRAAALVGAALVATSAASHFLAAEFLKQGLGLTLALAALASLAWALDRPGWARGALAAALILATAFTHKSSVALVLLVGAPAAWLHLREHDPRRARQALLAAAGLVAALLLLGTLMPASFPGPRDLGLVADAFTTRAEWDLPALALPHHRLGFGPEALLAPRPAAAALTVAWPRLPPFAIGFVALALILAIPWLDVHDVQGAALRLRAAAFVPLAPLAALVIARLVRADVPRVAACAALAAAALLVRPLAPSDGQSHTHPALVAAVRALDGVVPPGASVVTQDRKIAFMARWYARQPMQLHPVASAYRLMPGYWITAELRQALTELRATPPSGVALPRDLHPADENGLVLLPEATFEYLMTRVSPAARAHYHTWPTT